MKKLIRLIRSLLILIFWTWLFISVADIFMRLIWNFSFLSAKSWDILSTFWNQGGVIKTTSDVLLLLFLFLMPIFWFVGFILARKLNYISLFLMPFNLISRLFKRKESDTPERIVLKNLKSGQKMVDDIKAEIESLKPEKSEKAGNIRSEITKKLSQEIKN